MRGLMEYALLGGKIRSAWYRCLYVLFYPSTTGCRAGRIHAAEIVYAFNNVSYTPAFGSDRILGLREKSPIIG